MSGAAIDPSIPELLRRRGPDCLESYRDEHFECLNSRLAIIARSEQSLPAHSRDGTLVLCGSGAVLNYEELRPLVSEPPAGDFGLLCQLVLERGEAVLSLVRGPFSLVIWNREERRCVLARDPLGRNPLYCLESAGELVFSSDPEAIRIYRREPLRLARDAARLFVATGYRQTSESLLDGVVQPSPGEVWSIATPGRRETSRLALPQSDTKPIRELFRTALGRCYTGDFSPALAFSGGIDSTVVLIECLAQRRPIGPLLTLYNPRVDDRNLARARRVARELEVEIEEIPMPAPSMIAIEETTRRRSLSPPAWPQLLHNDVLHAEAAQHTRVLIGGHGADELFAGYGRYVDIHGATRHGSILRFEELARCSQRWPRARALSEAPVDAALGHFELDEEPLRRVFDDFDRELPIVPRDSTAKAQLIDLVALQAWDNFSLTDENGIANGVEVRSPFYDEDLLGRSFELRSEEKLEPKKKIILRDWIRPWVDDSITFGEKLGFDSFFDYDESLQPLRASMLDVARSLGLWERLGLSAPNAETESGFPIDVVWRCCTFAMWCARSL